MALSAYGITRAQEAGARSPVPNGLGATASSPSTSSSLSAQVAVAHHNQPLVVPRSFLGISTEYWTIPIWAAHLDLLGRVFSMIAQEGPVVLRIGGTSADQALWAEPVKPGETLRVRI
jgi:hypothetical protein